MQKSPITRKRLIDWAGEQVVREADAIVRQGYVLRADFNAPYIEGALLLNGRELSTRLRLLDDGNVENLCPCYANRERGIICQHVIALGLVLVKRATDPNREAKYQAELRRASRLAQIDEAAYLKRVPSGTPGGCPAALVLGLPADWQDHLRDDAAVPVELQLNLQGKVVTPDQVDADRALILDRFDTALLYVLEDIAEGPPGATLTVTTRDFINLLNLHRNRTLPCGDGTDLDIHAPPVTTLLRIDMDRATGELILDAHTECPFLAPGRRPDYVVAGHSGWAMADGHAWPLDNVLPEPYHAIYTAPIRVERPDVVRFMRHELTLLQRFARLESELTIDLFTIDPAEPHMRLHISGSPASLAATLQADYNGLQLVAARPDAQEHFAIPDPEDLMRYTVRNREAEVAALAVLADCGMRGETGDSLTPIVGERDVLNFLGARIPRLRRMGWRIELEGRVEPYFESLDFVTPVVTVNADAGNPWFDVGFAYESTDGASLSAADVQRAIRRGDAYLDSGDRRILIDTSAVESMLDVFTDCEAGEGAQGGRFRLSDLYAPFVKASLECLDGIDIEDSPAWRQRAAQMNRTVRMDDVPLPPALAGILRPYQKEGVNWLRFNEQQHFGGILADEMGLGKTLQTLTWLQLQRCDTKARGRPSLIVCPTTLVENWAEEAARFTGDLRVLILAGPDRHEKWEAIGETDLAITSYALLRRDLDQLLQTEFAAIVLDEAQHIKNRSTRNSLAAKKLRGLHKLVLTGTPVENSVADLWSIMDFLMPGYLGRHDDFRARYELPIARGGDEANVAQRKLRRKLHPFLLRRLKRDVAKELPPKIERTTFCVLSADQRVVYQTLLTQSRARINDIVSTKGFQRARMEVLTTLLRLRQACCHLDLLKLPGLKPEEPSAKLELFLELLDEALDGGHRMLVFSQFVSMLHILRAALDARELPYCYLDGSTKERMQEVHRFNTCRDIPVFLISLKAGGTGLNLTGADMVVHFDPWWNPAVENQATDRAYRIGQKRTVYSNKLITRGTVEEKVLQMQQRKQAVIDATVESDEAIVKAMSWEDVQELLEL